MYGTVARLRVKRGQEEALKALNAQSLRERQPGTTGFVADYVLKSERVPGELFVLAIFDSEESYRKNAADPRQHTEYEQLRALLEADPEWNDGEIIAFEPASVPV
jgi:heme-degrading monooxygenase HmoA